MTRVENDVLADTIELTVDQDDLNPSNGLGDELKITIEQNLEAASYSDPEMRRACYTFLKMDPEVLAAKARRVNPSLCARIEATLGL